MVSTRRFTRKRDTEDLPVFAHEGEDEDDGEDEKEEEEQRKEVKNIFLQRSTNLPL